MPRPLGEPPQLGDFQKTRSIIVVAEHRSTSAMQPDFQTASGNAQRGAVELQSAPAILKGAEVVSAECHWALLVQHAREDQLAIVADWRCPLRNRWRLQFALASQLCFQWERRSGRDA